MTSKPCYFMENLGFLAGRRDKLDGPKRRFKDHLAKLLQDEENVFSLGKKKGSLGEIRLPKSTWISWI